MKNDLFKWMIILINTQKEATWSNIWPNKHSLEALNSFWKDVWKILTLIKFKKKKIYIYIGIHTHTHTHTQEYYSVIKKKDIMPFAATWMDLTIIIQSEVSQTKTNITWYCLYTESKKMIKWTYLQNRNILTDSQHKLMVNRREG